MVNYVLIDNNFGVTLKKVPLLTVDSVFCCSNMEWLNRYHLC